MTRLGYGSSERLRFGPFHSNRGQLTQTGEPQVPEGEKKPGAPGTESRRDMGERYRELIKHLPQTVPQED